MDGMVLHARGQVGKTGRKWSITLLVVGVLLCGLNHPGCDAASTSGSRMPASAAAALRMEEQAAKYDALLKTSEEQTILAEQQIRRYDMLLTKWEQQAERIDRLLQHLEKIASQLEAGDARSGG